MPGLHLSLGIFNRLFVLLEEACNQLDLKFACRQDTTTSIGGESFQNYVALHKKLGDLQQQQAALAAKQSVLSQLLAYVLVSTSTTSPTAHGIQDEINLTQQHISALVILTITIIIYHN